VIINLVANARDATGTDGLIQIETGLDSSARGASCRTSS
jgi:signal transduction histidine kinase